MISSSSEPTSLMGVRFAYSAMEQALPHIFEEVYIYRTQLIIRRSQL